MRVIKNDSLGNKVWEYSAVIQEQTESAVLLRAHFNRDDLLFNGILFNKGDIFLELYPLNRWFNIYQIHDKKDNTIKGWYCNVTRPPKITSDQIAYDDLALDLLVYPDRKMLVLDEDEFSDLSLSSKEIGQAQAGLLQLQDIYSRSDPFDMHTYMGFI